MVSSSSQWSVVSGQCGCWDQFMPLVTRLFQTRALVLGAHASPRARPINNDLTWIGLGDFCKSQNSQTQQAIRNRSEATAHASETCRNHKQSLRSCSVLLPTLLILQEPLRFKPLCFEYARFPGGHAGTRALPGPAFVFGISGLLKA